MVFSYRNNPNVTAVFPSNTIPSGGITLTFTGVNLDVVQQPVLEVYQPMGAPPATTEQHHVIFDFFVLHNVLTLLQRSTCSIVDNTTIICSTPNLTTTSLTPLDYVLMFDDVPLTTHASLPISVQSDPSNFRLEGSQEVTSGTATLIRIVVYVLSCILTILLPCVYPG